MSLNITAASAGYLVCTTDRRLTTYETRRILSDGSSKLTVLFCADAAALITYNGIGLYKNCTPNDWILDLNTKRHLGSMKMPQVVEAIRDDAQQRISNMADVPDRRHTFVIGCIAAETPHLFVVSNYEDPDEGNSLTARPTFAIKWKRPARTSVTPPILVFATGATQTLKQKTINRLAAKIKSGAGPVSVRNQCTKIIRDASLGANRSVTVGNSVEWAYFQVRPPRWDSGLDVIGGTKIQTKPNVITPYYMMKGIAFSSEDILHLPDKPCHNCKVPVPSGYRKCGACGAAINW